MSWEYSFGLTRLVKGATNILLFRFLFQHRYNIEFGVLKISIEAKYCNTTYKEIPSWILSVFVGLCTYMHMGYNIFRRHNQLRNENEQNNFVVTVLRSNQIVLNEWTKRDAQYKHTILVNLIMTECYISYYYKCPFYRFLFINNYSVTLSKSISKLISVPLSP